MKKGTKVMVTIAGIFAVAGTCLCIAGVAMGATKESTRAIDEMVKAFRGSVLQLGSGAEPVRSRDSYVIYDDGKEENSTELSFAKNLEINLKYDELLFQEYNGDKIKVDMENDTDGDIQVSETDGKITITDKRSGTTKKQKSITIGVPAGKEFDSVVFRMDAGTVDMDGEFKIKNFTVEVGAGDFTGMGSVTADQCSLEVGAGTIDMEGLDAKKISADCGAGELDMELAGKEGDYNYELSCGLGEIDIQDSEYGGLGIDKTISNDGAERKLTLNCGMGQIDVEFLEED